MSKIPYALFNSEAKFNPYQYDPFFKIMNYENGHYIRSNKNILIADEVGVGKTIETGIILSELLAVKAEETGIPDLKVMIFCPVKLCENWQNELRNIFKIGIQNCNAGELPGLFSVFPYSYFEKGTKTLKEKNDAEKSLQKEKKTENGLSEADKKDLSKLPEYDVLILDEAHMLRNGGKLWERFEYIIIHKEKPGALRIFLTGTPIFNREKDLKNLKDLLNLNKDENEECESTAALQCQANCYDKLLTIEEKNVTASEKEKEIIQFIYNNPLKNRGFIKRIAASSLHSLKLFLDKHEFDDVINEFDDDYYDDDDVNDENSQNRSILKEKINQLEGDSKLDSLKKLLGKLTENSEKPFKAIIFSCFIDTCTYLGQQIKQLKFEKDGKIIDFRTFEIIGGSTAKSVSNNIEAFKKCGNNAVLICSDAAREGHNLQFCEHIIHYDLPYSPSAIAQRNGRIYRKGQLGNPTAYYMLTDCGYDLRLYGEIITQKCALIKRFSDMGAVPMLNVLPSDKGETIKNSLKTFIEDYFSLKNASLKEKNDSNNDDDEIDEEDNSTTMTEDQRIGRMFLRKYFAFKKTFANQEVKAAYDKIKNENVGSVITYLVNLMMKIVENSQNSTLRDTYMKQYIAKLKELHNSFFGENIEDCKDIDAVELFIKKCEENFPEDKIAEKLGLDELLDELSGKHGGENNG